MTYDYVDRDYITANDICDDNPVLLNYEQVGNIDWWDSQSLTITGETKGST